MRDNVLSDSGLTPKQEVFLDALLTLPLEAAARAAKINGRTGRRWLTQSHIQSALRTRRKEAAEGVLQGLLSLGDKARDTLDKGMDADDSPWSSRIRASQIALEQITQQIQFAALEQEVQELRQTLAELTARGLVE